MGISSRVALPRLHCDNRSPDLGPSPVGHLGGHAQHGQLGEGPVELQRWQANLDLSALCILYAVECSQSIGGILPYLLE